MPGRGAANYLVMIDVGWSHSLLMVCVWGALVARVYYLRQGHVIGAVVLLGAVLSHWLLDVASHRPDMPLAPWGSARLGLGLWTSVPWTIVVEGGLWLVAIVLYTRATRAATSGGACSHGSHRLANSSGNTPSAERNRAIHSPCT